MMDEIEITIVVSKKENGHVGMQAKMRGVTKSKTVAKVVDELFTYIGKFNPSELGGKKPERVIDTTRGSGPQNN